MHPRGPTALLLLLSLSECTAAPPPRPVRPAPVVTDGVIDVGRGIALHVHCVGDGGPVLVLDTGLGGDGSMWSSVQPQLGAFTRTCAYDRAGRGYSSPAPKGHTAQQMAEELHAMLHRAGLPPPYVLVGHSIGGLVVRLFAAANPTEVAGMVLVDASTEDQDARQWPLLTEEQRRTIREGMEDAGEGIDFDAFEASLAPLRGPGRSLGDTPLVVLTRGRNDPEPGFSDEVEANLGQIWQQLQAGLPPLSTNSAQFLATNSGHMIPQEAPRLFVAAVRVAVDAARGHAPLDRHTLDGIARQTASVTSEDAVTRLFTAPLSQDWFAPSRGREAWMAETKRVLDELARELGAFRHVDRDGPHLTARFESGFVTADVQHNEDGQLTLLSFGGAVRTAESPPAPH